MREALQLYDAYTSLLPDSHRVVVSSMSLGTLPNLVICAKARRKPDASVLLSPLNSQIDFRLSGKLVAWIGKQVMKREWLSDIIIFTRSSVSPKRVNEYDTGQTHILRRVCQCQHGILLNPQYSRIFFR